MGMQKILMTLGCVLTLVTAKAQEKGAVKKDSIVWKLGKIDYSCEGGKQQAELDFKFGKYNCFSYGLVVQQDVEFENFYTAYLHKKYKIIRQNMGCVVTDYDMCYSETMITLVKEKFGEDIFKKAREEAKKLYKKK
jgi:hypothetical protein